MAQLYLPLWLSAVIQNSLGFGGFQHSFDVKVMHKPVYIGMRKCPERSKVFYFTTWFLKVEVDKHFIRGLLIMGESRNLIAEITVSMMLPLVLLLTV